MQNRQITERLHSFHPFIYLKKKCRTVYVCPSHLISCPKENFSSVIPFSQHTLAGWRKVFWVAAVINVVGAVIFTIFGSGNIQPWALMEEKREEVETKGTTTVPT